MEHNIAYYAISLKYIQLHSFGVPLPGSLLRMLALEQQSRMSIRTTTTSSTVTFVRLSLYQVRDVEYLMIGLRGGEQLQEEHLRYSRDEF